MGIWRRLFGPPPAPSPRLRDAMIRLDELDADLAGLRKRVDKLQGIVTSTQRADNSRQDAPGPQNFNPAEIPAHPPHEGGSLHLSRRFRTGG